MSYPSYDELRKGVKHYMAELEKEKQRSKVLVEALEYIRCESKPLFPPFGRGNRILNQVDMVKIADEALKKYEEMGK